MITIKRASKEHIEGIAKVCIDGYWATYKDLYSANYINRMIQEFYTYERIAKELTPHDTSWLGWLVAVENGEVVGATGGGMISEHAGELFVLYLNPRRRNQGIGTLLLDAITNQIKEHGAMEQWVSVSKGNMKGIPFYEAKGFTCRGEQAEYGSLKEENYRALRYHRHL